MIRTSESPPDANEAPSRADLPERFDAIVIGSGIGGLTAASLLAQRRGMQVLVLERHARLGGFTHAFRRPAGWRWDVGLHYIGQMDERHPARRLMDEVTGGRVDWRPLPSPFERFVFPGLAMDQPAGREAWREALVARWPAERRGIDRYFREVAAASNWMAPYLLAQGGPAWTRWPAAALRWLGRGQALRTTGEVLDGCVTDPALKAVLAAPWGDYGLPPSLSAFAVHATVAAHYFDGGWYPVGGGEAIVAAARSVIEAAGGACLASHEVETVLVERGRAVGVRARRGQGRREPVEFRAPVVISDAGARLTYERLIPEESAPPALATCRDGLRRLPGATSMVQLFLGLKDSPDRLGFRGENHWLFDGIDHDALYARRNALAEGQASMAFLSFPSVKDPTATAPTAEIVAPLDYGVLAQWAGRPWHRRGAEYETVKAGIADTLLGFVERHYPGFGDQVAYRELATPLSVEHFAAHPAGAVYGLPAVPARYRAGWLGIATPLPGLVLTGSDVAGHGIAGAMMGGVATAGHVLGGLGAVGIMASATRSGRSRRHPARPSASGLISTPGHPAR